MAFKRYRCLTRHNENERGDVILSEQDLTHVFKNAFEQVGEDIVCPSVPAPKGYWTPKETMTGEDVFIVGGGASLLDFNFELLRGRRVIGVNGAVNLGDLVEVVFFSDLCCLTAFAEGFMAYRGQVVTNQYGTLMMPDVHTTRSSGDDLSGAAAEGVIYCRNSGMGALNLALLMGARRVFLLGYDCKPSGDDPHEWYPGAKGRMKGRILNEWVRDWNRVAKQAGALFPEVKIANLYEGSGIDCFPKMPRDEFFKGA